MKVNFTEAVRRMAEAEGAGGASEEQVVPPAGEAVAAAEPGKESPSPTGAEKEGEASRAAATAKDGAPDWATRRIDTLTANWRGTERALEEEKARVRILEATVEEFQKNNPEALKGLTDKQIQEKAEAVAKDLLAQREWDTACNNLYEKGKSTFKAGDGTLGWDDALAKFKQAGGLPSPVIAAALDTDDPSGVIYELAQDLNEAAKIFGLSPTKMAIRLDRMAQDIARRQVEAAEKAKPKVSKAPAPVEPESGSEAGEDFSGDPEKWPSDKWHAWREKQVAKQRQNGRMLQ